VTKILVVEDEPKVAGALKEGLDSEGYDVTLAATGEEGFVSAVEHRVKRFEFTTAGLANKKRNFAIL
jgi:DNA-binding response OmpR family regulator